MARNVVAAVLDADELVLEDARHVRVPGEATEQGLVDERLDEAVLARPAERLAARVVGEDNLAVAVDQTHDVVRDGERSDLVRQAHRLDGPERLVVQAHPARVVDELRARLGEDDLTAVLAEEVGQRQSDRPGADD